MFACGDELSPASELSKLWIDTSCGAVSKAANKLLFAWIACVCTACDDTASAGTASVYEPVLVQPVSVQTLPAAIRRLQHTGLG